MFKRVLVPIDGSAQAARALAEAVDLASATGAELTVMTSIPDAAAWSSPLVTSDPLTVQAALKAVELDYQAILEAACETVPTTISVHNLVTHGAPGPAIVAQVDEGGYDLVVMGSRGRGAVAALFLGSVSHHVLNAARAAVLVVRSGTDR